MLDINEFVRNKTCASASLATMMNFGSNFGLTYLLSIYMQGLWAWTRSRQAFCS